MEQDLSKIYGMPDHTAMAAEYYALQLIKSGLSIEDVKTKFYSDYGDDLKLMLFKSLNTAIAHMKKDAYKEGRTDGDTIHKEAAHTLMIYAEEIFEIFHK